MLGISLPSRSLDAPSSVDRNVLTHPYVFVFAAAVVLLYGAYRWALPKPIPTIPYNVSATRNLLGDIPSLANAMKGSGEFNLWLMKQAEKHRSPLFQVFIRPFGKPTLVLCDFREAQDVLMRRKDFDRSTGTGDLLEGVGPKHHIHMKTGPEWKQHRRLLQDLMSPAFLNQVAGPTVYKGVRRLIDLWNDKARLARGRPFVAETDIYYAALDAVLAFTFGDGFPHSAIEPLMDAAKNLGPEDVQRLGGGGGGGGGGGAVAFPVGECDERITASLEVTECIRHMIGSPVPRLKWKLVERRPEVRRAIQVKNDYVLEEIGKALRRIEEHGDEESKVLSAVELVVLREKKLAEHEGRQPDFFSRTMIDEVFGVVVAGHDTTSTTMCWGVKLLADNPEIQTRLREALRNGLPGAAAEQRTPTIREMADARIPYLDATMEEILRCGGAAPLVDREATCDTELLGHRVPRGTVVMCLSRGPSVLRPALPVDESKRSGSSLAAKARVWDDEDIGRFKPERWLVGNGGTAGEDDGEFDQQAGPSLAFGLGTRGCFGRRLAYLELRLLVTLIAWSFELLPCPEELSGYGGREGLTYKPRDCYVRLKALGNA
ncbi:Cytochrome P450 monooxygenase TRI13 [Colletotrichum spinosum]|uniref:Cytochrome P450 monooxygenase TRI13 n=1 Tax=Colletotrichum spinosum TaxID=1347390 RepID=A0A4R8QM22_9PEZI|nr:Cytochrome P450 monooxygenase TRI13 [Colletotrichum spinosum]